MTVTVGHALAEVAVRLAAAGIDNPRLEARLLVAAATGMLPTALFAHPEIPLGPGPAEALAALAGRRTAREPMSHILGQREFWGLPIRVSADTLTPRPDSETLIEAVLAWLKGRKAEALRLLDLGTGSGCLLLALLHELPRADGLGIDASPDALAVARGNGEALGLADRATFQEGNWGQGREGPFDVIVSNPPYIPTADIAGLMPEVRDHEPRRALDGGPDGLDAYRALLPDAVRLLARGGGLFLEVGAGQADTVATLGKALGLRLLEVRNDLAGISRCVAFASGRPER
ncbi:MAG: peptide chain release factor N(5)-glutamine methyltransferase [Magnetospirillum sp. WYHS-4]